MWPLHQQRIKRNTTNIWKILWKIGIKATISMQNIYYYFLDVSVSHNSVFSKLLLKRERKISCCSVFKGSKGHWGICSIPFQIFLNSFCPKTTESGLNMVNTVFLLVLSLGNKELMQVATTTAFADCICFLWDEQFKPTDYTGTLITKYGLY